MPILPIEVRATLESHHPFLKQTKQDNFNGSISSYPQRAALRLLFISAGSALEVFLTTLANEVSSGLLGREYWRRKREGG